MKKIKRLFLLILLTIFVFPLVKVSADSSNDLKTVYSENGKGGFTTTSNQKSTIYGMEYNYVLGETISQDTLNSQELNVFSMKTDGVYSKLVNWAYQDTNCTYKRVTLDVLAKNYEDTHPGWIVLGGINGDQYAMSSRYAESNVPFYPQPFYPLTIDGERRFTVGLFGASGSFVGLSNNGEANPFVYESARKGYYIYVYNDNDEVIKEIKLDGFNENAQDNKTTVWMSYQKLNADSSGAYVCPEISGNHLFIVENPELQYVSNAPEYVRAGKTPEFVGFGRGTISKVTTEHKVEKAQFAIDTNDADVINSLKVGTKIVVQDSYVDEKLNEVEFTAGYHTAHRLNDKDVEGVGSYDTKQYSRSIFGRKADGTYVLLTASRKTGTYRGLNQNEANAYLKSIGVVEAYQQDGGGSVCAIVRNSIGNFDIVNMPTDGATRANFNGLLFVVRDPGYKVNTVHNTRNSIVVYKEDNINTDKVKNMKITVDGKMYPMENETLEITGLQEDTEYDVTFTFYMKKEKTDEYKTVSYVLTTKTKAFEMPTLGLKFTDIGKNSFRIVKRQSDTSSWFRDIVIHMNDGEYVMGSNDELLIEDLPENTKFDVEITFNCVEPTTGNVYPGKIKKTVTTLSYNVPTISKFIKTQEKNNRVTIEYKYVDDDELVMSAVLKVNDEDIPLTTKTGIQTIKDLDLEHQEYKIQLVVTYVVGTTAKNVKSEIITVGTNNPIISHNITYNLDGGTNNELNPSSYVEGEEVILKEATKEGYKFIGWYTGETKVTSISPEAKEDIELTAKWEKIKEKYQITYILNGGTNNASNPSTYEEGEKVILKEATKEGYKFLGWYKDGELVTEVKEGNVTVEARFEEIKNQDSEKKGCNCKKTIEMVITLTSAVTLLAFVLRKKH